MRILALCRVRVFCTCVLLYQINHARAIACTYNVCTVCIQCTVYTEGYVVLQFILVISTHKSRRSRHISNYSTHKMSPLTVEMLKSIFLFL